MIFAIAILLPHPQRRRMRAKAGISNGRKTGAKTRHHTPAPSCTLRLTRCEATRVARFMPDRNFARVTADPHATPEPTRRSMAAQLGPADSTREVFTFAEMCRRKQRSRTHATSRAVVGEHPARGKMICAGDVAKRLRTYKCKSCIPRARGQVVGASGTRNRERQRDAGPKRSRQRLRAGPGSASARERPAG